LDKEIAFEWVVEPEAALDVNAVFKHVNRHRHFLRFDTC